MSPSRTVGGRVGRGLWVRVWEGTWVGVREGGEGVKGGGGEVMGRVKE